MRTSPQFRSSKSSRRRRSSPVPQVTARRGGIGHCAPVTMLRPRLAPAPPPGFFFYGRGGLARGSTRGRTFSRTCFAVCCGSHARIRMREPVAPFGRQEPRGHQRTTSINGDSVMTKQNASAIRELTTVETGIVSGGIMPLGVSIGGPLPYYAEAHRWVSPLDTHSLNPQPLPPKALALG